jgi:membrane associated rhomboid family serine protease
MIPLRDENPSFSRAIITLGIIALNLFVWVALQGFGTEPALSQSVCRFGLIPGRLFGVLKEGTQLLLAPQAICTVDSSHYWYTLLSSMFMHGGWFHIIMNMWFLFVFGDNVEDSMGKPAFLLFYLLCGFSAALAQIAANPQSALPMVGASGAIGGVMGAYAAMYPRAPVQMLVFLGFFITRVVVPAWVLLGYWFLLQLLSGLAALGREEAGVAFMAHIGGFVAGLLLSYVFRNEQQVKRHRAAIRQRLNALGD